MYLIKSQYPVYVNLETSCHCEKASDDCQQASREGSNLVFEIEIAASRHAPRNDTCRCGFKIHVPYGMKWDDKNTGY